MYDKLETMTVMRDLGASKTAISYLYDISVSDLPTALTAETESNEVLDSLADKDTVMQAALLASFFQADLNAPKAEAFLNSFFHYGKMMEGGEKKLSFNNGVRLMQALKSNQMVLSKCNNCSAAIISRSAGICGIRSCEIQST